MATGFFSFGRHHKRHSPPVGVYHLEERTPYTSEDYAHGMYTPQQRAAVFPKGHAGETVMTMGVGANGQLVQIPYQDQSGYLRTKTGLVMQGAAE